MPIIMSPCTRQRRHARPPCGPTSWWAIRESSNCHGCCRVHPKVPPHANTRPSCCAPPPPTDDHVGGFSIGRISRGGHARDRRPTAVSCTPVTKHIFVTGGVASSLGKGLTASSLG